ncbi:MAG: 2,3-bisphosphoglycerate-independent phosphoglycerate mutase [Patescibacteria group bacterium]|nr:2,3-bisphosphoglycerate-independent phosphoglycerate mutase [Patescibacteria group bacterium]MDW8279612.1 2,3-bisphosphoglycerate-independent phosphoglycerate mutase [bacterium]
MNKSVALIVLDGLGLGLQRETNPVYAASPQNLLELEKQFPVTSLSASGITVGLPWGEEGNCEAGHLTMGAGKIFYQNYPLITMAIKDGSFFKNKNLNQALDFVRKNNSKVNLVGLLSKGISESALEHIQALVEIMEDKKINYAFHFFADGIDSPKNSFLNLLKNFSKEKLGSVIGRYYALDHKNNFNLVKRAYDCLIGDINEVSNFEEIIKNHYEKGLNDNILPPILINKNKAIQENDAVIFFNFKEDNVKSIVEPFFNYNFDKFNIKKFNNLFILTMVQYDKNFNLPYIFEPQIINKPLSLILSENNKSQFKISESLKYSLITFYFNGLNKDVYENEFRVSIPSGLNADLVNHPEMASRQITDRLIEAINNKSFDFILANYANLDILGHLADFDLAVKAIKIIDQEIGRLVKSALDNDVILIITSDHGKIEQIINLMTGELNTEHTKNPVPLYLIGNEFKGKKFPNFDNFYNETLGLLSDVAPTILELMNIPKPEEMTGKSLLKDLF